MADVQALGTQVQAALSILELCNHRDTIRSRGNGPAVCSKCCDRAREALKLAVKMAENAGWRPPSAF